ncbi:MAG: hypothetical protein JWP69_124 [Flaviaesturariibacter sp.]|nr:hypothetical protein [Flaviaesturariibacter sp.]
MSLTFLQERKLAQYKEEIAFLEKQVEKQDGWYAVRLSWIVTMIFYILGFFVDYMTEGSSLPEYVIAYGWKKPIWNFTSWLLIYYFFLVRGNRRTLRKRREELTE